MWPVASLPTHAQATKLSKSGTQVRMHLGVYWGWAGGQAWLSHFLGDEFGGGKLINARRRLGHQRGWRDVVRVVTLVEVLADLRLGQGEDP